MIGAPAGPPFIDLWRAGPYLPGAAPFARSVPSESCMARDVVDAEIVESRDDLVAWLEAGCRPAQAFRVGSEHEKIPFYKSDLTPVPYEGPRGICALLEGMGAGAGWSWGLGAHGGFSIEGGVLGIGRNESVCSMPASR